MNVHYIAAFAAAIFYAVSAVLEDRGAKQTPISGKAGKRSALKATLRGLYLIGMALSVVAWVLSLFALQSLPLFAVTAIAASSIGIIVLINWAMTGAAPPRLQAVLLTVLAVGLAALAIAAAPSDPKRVSWVFSLGVWVGVALVIAASLRAAHLQGNAGAAALGVVSGLADGGVALCARAIHANSGFLRLLINPLAIALVVLAVIGVVAFAGALQRGSVAIALACQQAVMTIVPSAVGLAFLGDRARHGFAPVTVVGFVLTVGTVVALTLTRPDDVPVPPASLAPGAPSTR